jgi:regulation of enolase protein 1 (concanavalin A-like superfamily)
MHDLKFRLAWPAFLCAGLLTGFSLAPTARSQTLVPADVGTTVNGYQDDFDGAALASGWLMVGANVYSVSGGSLHVSTPAGDPNHLLYAVAGYNNSVQEVLARIRVVNFGTGDPSRGGISTCVDPAASPAGGIDLHFRDENLGRHIEFLDDLRAWGTEYQFNWLNNTWYWLRLRHDPNAAAQGGVNDVFGKIWPADGNTAEPAAWQDVYDYIPSRSARTGYAGLVAGSTGGLSEFEVDYILIKASGLPSILVAPAAFPLVQTPVAITTQPQNQTVLQCQPVTFSVVCSGTPPYTFQWSRDDSPIGGATDSTYTLANVQPSDNGAVFRVVAGNVASNVAYNVTSAAATLSVSLDITAPALRSATSAGLNQLVAAFSEPLAAATANNRFNYAVSGPGGSLSVVSATLAADGTNVTLVISGQIEGVVYTLTVNNLTDECTGVNTIAANSQATFSTSAYAATDIGSPTPAGGSVGVLGGYDVTGGGSDIGGTNDHFQFSYQTRAGDFDLKVRLDALAASDTWAEAGLMARESTAAGSRFAAVLATPSISGCAFQARGLLNGASPTSGSFPVNYPNTWLRLQRSGNQFTGYAGFDGQHWALLGTTNLALPSTVSFGFAVSSHNSASTTTARFRELSAVTAAANALPSPSERLGQASRLTSLVFSEIMYHPGDTRGVINTNDQGFVTNSLEFVEIYNALGTPEDLSGFRLSGNIDYRFPAGTIMPGGGFLVVARSPDDVASVYGLSGVLGPFTNNLPNSGGTVRLRNRADAVLLEVNYDTQPPWPISPDGAGHSLVLARPSLGLADPRAWAASDAVGGSPGRGDSITTDPLSAVVINEFLAHTDLPDLDFVELYNTSSQSLDLGGASLSDSPDTNKFIFPAGTTIPGHGFLVRNELELGFALKAEGDTLYLRNASHTRVLDAVRFEAQGRGISSGRSPDGGSRWRPLAVPTPGAANAAPWSSDIVINELYYNPISKEDDDQFVELYNRGTNPVSLAGWKFTSGINYTFPANASIAPGAYLVVARNAARMALHYGNLGASNLFGDFGGKLSHNGERIALAAPDAVITTNAQGGFATNINHVVVNEVTYGTGGRWGQWSDAGGSSLELRDPRNDNNLAANWADSDETAKAPWTTVSATGVLDFGTVPADQLQVLLQGTGECLIDEVQVLNSVGANLIANSTFETDASGWTAEGTEQGSSLETSGGYNSARSYHIRATDRADNQINRLRTPLTTAQPSGATVTIRAQVRWLRGHPEVLFRLRGNWLEAVGIMNLPPNPGTPGARNSRAVNNAPPAISDVIHSPVLPAGGQPCVVTARVSDPDAPLAVTLRYRVDPAASYASVNMVDNGTGDDAVAGDGIYTGTIPGQAAGSLVAFVVQAADRLSSTATFPIDAPARECLVRFGETQPAGSFPVYRIWMTAATLSTWNGRSKLDNTPLDITFVLGNQRVIYNTRGLYAGSPYIAPGYQGATATRCGYSITFPGDDLFLGSADLVLDWPGGHGNENTAMQEQMGYWIAERLNLPTCHRYLIRLHVNGVTDDQRQAVFEAVNQPAAEFIKSWSPDDSNGDFYKVDRGFEFSDAGGLVADPMPTLQVFNTTGGVKKEARYRWNWNKRAADSANNHTNIFNLADALNGSSPEPYTSQSAGLVDIDEWMGIFAVEHIINNFDAYGHDIGKNMYAYKPEHGKWQLYMFDLDWLMLAAPAGPGNYTATSGPLFSGNDTVITRMYAHPPFRRAYFRFIQDAVDDPLLSSKCDPVMDAKYASLLANGIQYCDGQALAAPTAVKTWFSQRRTALLGQLASVASPFTVSNAPTTLSSNLVTLTGTAPITVATIFINGVPWPVTWTSVSNWTVRLPVDQGASVLQILGYDSRNQLVAGASNQVTVTYDGPVADAPGNVVINEIMYNPTLPRSEYIELFNTSSNFTFDLGGWRVNGLDYTFPSGSFIQPRRYLTLVQDRGAAGMAYGTNQIFFDEYPGNLQADGETLTLLKPGAAHQPDVVINKVRYSPDAPWPSPANGTGSSLQLVDASQDNARVSNWAAGGGSGWRYFSYTGAALATRLLLFLEVVPGEAYIDDLQLVAGSVPGAGPNMLRNGDFEGPLTTNNGGPWVFFGPYVTNSTIDSTVSHSGSSCLHFVCSFAGGSSYMYQDVPVTNGTYSISYWYLQATNDTRLNTRLSTAFRPSNPLRVLQFTPGAANSVAGSVAPYAPVWINEALPQNLDGITDNQGQRDPWVELYNAGSSPVPLDGWFLSDNYSNLTQWPFPAGATLNPGEFKVLFADGEPGQTTASEWHTSFRLLPGAGSVALSRPVGGGAEVVDYLNYRDVLPGRSYGSFPDGQPFDRQEFYVVTPRGTNNGMSAPITVSINEWMASNTQTISDPATASLKFDDWFELYNRSATTADLGGYYLTDELTNKFKFRIPAGYSIPPHGFLLVWADNESQQNSSNLVDLHVDFSLNKDGESIGLFAPDGTAIDTVTFLGQTNDVSQGRLPDGSPNIVFLPAPTPRTPNLVGANIAPVLSPIGNRSVHRGQVVTFTAVANDADQPPQLLTFSLDAGAPAGASINPATGLFTWPTAGLPAGTNTVTIRVTDNGAPSLSDAEAIQLIVLDPPSFHSTRLGNQLTLGWGTIPGRTYRVEFTDDLEFGVWQSMGGNTVAGGSSLSLTVTLTSPAQRFFRIVVMP